MVSPLIPHYSDEIFHLHVGRFTDKYGPWLPCLRPILSRYRDMKNYLFHCHALPSKVNTPNLRQSPLHVYAIKVSKKFVFFDGH
jgi:hypothetical protein